MKAMFRNAQRLALLSFPISAMKFVWDNNLRRQRVRSIFPFMYYFLFSRDKSNVLIQEQCYVVLGAGCEGVLLSPPQIRSGINGSILDLSGTQLYDRTQSEAGKEHMWQQTFSSSVMSEQPSSSFRVLPGQAWSAHRTCMPMKARETQV